MISLKHIIDRFAAQRSKETMKALMNQMQSESVLDEDIAYLASQLASSGIKLISGSNEKTAAFASTGGATSLSTLLGPLCLRALGYKVPNLSVPGRPAGGIDVMAQLPGYSVSFTKANLQHILSRSGYVNFLAGGKFTPLDALLFYYRQRAGTQQIVPLAIASILSKKLAAGATLVGLDVRMARHGNFGVSLKAARDNAEQFCRVAALLGMTARCFLTNAEVPYQPYIGRSEALLALADFFQGQASGLLEYHANICLRMGVRTIGGHGITVPTISTLVECFKDNLWTQGCSFDKFTSYVDKIRRARRIPILASQTGFLKIDLGQIKSIIVSLQNQHRSPRQPFPDPCGLILSKSAGEFVHSGETIGSIRISHIKEDTAVQRIREAFLVVSGVDPIFGVQEVAYAKPR